MDRLSDTLLLVVLAIALLPMLAVMWIFVGTVCSDLLTSRKCLRHVKKFPLRWMFVGSAAICMAFALSKSVSLPIGMLVGFVATSVIYIFYAEILTTTNPGKGPKHERRFACRDGSDQLAVGRIERRKSG